MAVAALVVLVYYFTSGPGGSSYNQDGMEEGNGHPSYNRTLGFGEILVAVVPSISAEHFHHQLHTLSLTAHHTRIDIRTFEGGGDKKYTKVWRGHMNMLRYVLEQKLETVLILEGDVDWDVRIKQQLHLLSTHLPGASEEYPYGDDWSALWLSECGDDVGDDLKPHIVYADETLAVPSVRSDASTLGEQFMRNVLKSKRSGCTIGYAVTPSGAKRILDEIGLEHVNMAIDREEIKSYLLPGLKILPPLFEEWSSEEGNKMALHAPSRIGRSVRKALYHS